MKKLTRKKRKSTDTDELEIERLQKEIRELKQVNRSLMKRLKKVDRDYNKVFEEEIEVNNLKSKNKNDCHQCGKGFLKDNTGIPGRVFRTCSNCDYKSKIEKIK